MNDVEQIKKTLDEHMIDILNPNAAERVAHLVSLFEQLRAESDARMLQDLRFEESLERAGIR